MLRSTGRKAMAMAFFLVLGSTVSVLAAGSGASTVATPASDSADPQPDAKASTPAEAQPNAPSAASFAPLRSELQQLKESVEGESERIARESQEIDAQRAELREQLDRIAELEARMQSPRSEVALSTATPAGALPTPVLGSPSTTMNRAAVDNSANPPQVSTPSQGSVDRRLGDLEQRMKKLGPLSFSGDFRLREDAFYGGPGNRSLDQNLQNYRLRFNTDVQLSDDLNGGFTLASGNINDPTSTNQTLTGFYARKPIALDRAFINYHPQYFKPLTLVAGKFTYPWYNTELTWDKDLNPEGFAQTLNFDLKSTPVLKRVALIGFELPFSQMAGVSLQNKSLMQSAVFGGQFQTEWRLSAWATLTAYSGFYNFHNADPMALALSEASAKNPSTPLTGLLPLAGGGGTVQNSEVITTATSVVNLNGTLVPTGVTKISNAQFASKFGLFDNIARFDFKTPAERWPIAVIGDYVQNTEACANAGNILAAPANTATTVYTQSLNFACNSHQRRAYWAEVEVGRIARKHDLQLGYMSMFIEREAVLSNLNYNQIYQGSNVTEQRISVFYTVRSNVIFDFIGLFGRPLNFGNSAPPIDTLKRLQFDVNYVF